MENYIVLLIIFIIVLLVWQYYNKGKTLTIIDNKKSWVEYKGKTLVITDDNGSLDVLTEPSVIDTMDECITKTLSLGGTAFTWHNNRDDVYKNYCFIYKDVAHPLRDQVFANTYVLN